MFGHAGAGLQPDFPVFRVDDENAAPLGIHELARDERVERQCTGLIIFVKGTCRLVFGAQPVEVLSQ